jgi:uncharacterized protein YlxW (UPF0749 family)
MIALVLAQAVADEPGFGAAEIIGIATVCTLVIGSVTTLIVQMVKLRKENTDQHTEGRALVTDVRDRLLDLHTSVNKVDHKVDRLDERLDGHLEWHTDKAL